MTIRVESDLPVTGSTFSTALQSFETQTSGDDTIVVRHHFLVPAPIPGFVPGDGMKQVYRKAPWAIYHTSGGWLYRGIGEELADPPLGLVAQFADDYRVGDVYSTGPYADVWSRGGVPSLTLFSTDQILLARLLADRQGLLLHSAGVSIDGHGLLFAGHSDAGKSTTAHLLRTRLGSRATVLCDDRNAARWWPRGFGGGPPGFYAHGTWSHGDVPLVSPEPAGLRAILFLEQAAVNELVPMIDRREITHRLLATLIKPLATADWWEKELDVLQALTAAVPCYTMRFDTSGAIVEQLEALVR